MKEKYNFKKYFPAQSLFLKRKEMQYIYYLNTVVTIIFCIMIINIYIVFES